MSTTDRGLRLLGVLLAASTGLGLIAALVLLELMGADAPAAFRSEMALQDVMILALGGPGAWLLVSRPRHPAGWLLTSSATALLLNSLGGAWVVFATSDGRALPLAPVALVLVRLGSLSEAGVPLLLLLFPDGRLPSPRWRPVLWATVAGCALLAAVSLLVPLAYVLDDAAPGEVPPAFRTVPDLTGLAGVPAGWWPVLLGAVTLIDGVLLVPALLSLLVRYRRADVTETAQLRWLAVGGLVMLVSVVVSRLAPATLGMPVSAGAALILASTIVVAVMRYRLGDAALTLNRTLVYVVLTGLVTALYAAVVASATVVVGDRTAPWLAAAAVAAAFAPMRTRLQTAMDRRLRGERTDPYRVVSGLSRRLDVSHDTREVVSATVDTIAAAFRATWVRIELTGAQRLVVERGTPSAGTVVPLLAHQERCGTVGIALPPGARLSERDLALVADLARQCWVVVQTVDYAEQLERARATLVAAREEERRRVRRDLHDGLGPQLAGLTLKLDAIRNLMARDPDGAAALVADAKRDVLDAVEDVRRVSRDLRPPALDEVGLVGALRQQVARLERPGTSHPTRAGSGPSIHLDAPASVGALPAAVEVAAYRIVSEALTNVVRHSEARRCEVCLRLLDGPTLAVDVRDDGVGLLGRRHGGVGLSSMRERAREVGGECDVRTGDGGGTVVTARLPVMAR